MTELERRLLEALERTIQEHAEDRADLMQKLRDLTGRVDALAGQVEGLTSLLRRVVQP